MNGSTGSTETETDVESASMGQLVGEVISDLSTLMRQELDLAKAEMRAEASKAGKAAGLLGGSGLAGWMMLLFASLALMWWLDDGLDIAVAALIVAAIWAVIGVAMYLIGRKRLADINAAPERTVESVKEDISWAKNRTR